MKKGKTKKTVLIVISIIIIVISIVLFLTLPLNLWGFKEFHFYTVDNGGMGDCGSISTYHGDTVETTNYNNSKKSSKSPKCTSAGYYIDNNKVTIDIGDMYCGNSIKITDLKVDKKMNVYIKAKEIETIRGVQCGCSPNLTIYFLKKVNSVTLVTEDGTELGKC